MSTSPRLHVGSALAAFALSLALHAGIVAASLQAWSRSEARARAERSPAPSTDSWFGNAIEVGPETEPPAAVVPHRATESASAAAPASGSEPPPVHGATP